MTELVQIGVSNIAAKNLNTIQSLNIRDHFPFPEVRPAQNKAFNAIERAYRENKKYIIIEAPTGSGKSGIAVAAGSFAKTQSAYGGAFEPGAYILSPQKSLTAQYMGDFGSEGHWATGLFELKGRSNYTCTSFVDENDQFVDCEIGGMLCRTEKTDEEDGGTGCSFCPYKEAKKVFCSNPLGVTNFSYYLNETNYAGQLLPRHMLILDEGHNCENQILSLADIVINRYRCEEIGLDFLSMPVVKPGQTTKGLEWVVGTFRPSATALIMKWESDLKDLKEDGDTQGAAKLGKKLNGLKRFVGKLDMFANSAEENVADWIVYTDDSKGSESYGCLIIKPLTAKLFAEDILFSKAQKIIIMSATIGDFSFFMRNLGIDANDAVTCRIECDFPVENRPVFVIPVANMSSTKVGCPECSTPDDAGRENRSGRGCPHCYKTGQVPSIDVAMPKVAAKLSAIMDKFSKVKGIVHCLDAATRVLTDSGFKSKDELAIGDRAVTLNQVTGFIEYQLVENLVKRQHTGKMVKVDTRNLSMLVTPEHRTLALIGKNGTRSMVFEAQNLVTGMCAFGKKKARIFKIPKTGKWKGTPVDFNLARFLGWFCSEGCAYTVVSGGGKAYRVDISQNGIDNTDIPSLITRLGYHAYVQKSKGGIKYPSDHAIITNKKLCLHLRDICYAGCPSAKTKKVPDIIRDADPESIKQFLLTLVEGDGSTRNNKAVRSEWKHMQFYTSSRTLCEGVVELALKCGWSASFDKPDRSRWGVSTIHGRPIDNSGDIYVVYIGSGTKTLRVLPGDASFVDYDGEVFCPTVPNGVIFVERKGKCYWTGNCNSYKVTKFMASHVQASDRVLTHTSAKGDRDTVIVRHIESLEPTVLMSPSMAEGLDLKDDLSRFSVICKVPFAALDPYVKARMQRDHEWYAYQTALKLVQATGRSNRHKEDKAKHFILDSAIIAFLARYEHLFPEWWLAAVQRLKVE